MPRRVLLIVNPKAGRGGFDSLCGRVVELLSDTGFEAVVQRTTSEPHSAQRIAAEASATSDLVIACGGDGTVHEVLQGLAGTTTHLGVLPFGTANALARNLQLPTDPLLALKKLLAFRAREIPLGSVKTTTGTRYFTIMTGAGPDGGLIYDMSLDKKLRSGKRAYYTLAARHFLTRRFPAFTVEYRLVGSDKWTRQPATAMMVSRIPDLGGVFKGLTTASSLHHPYLLLQLIAAPAHLGLPAWFAFGRLGFERFNPWLTRLRVEEVRCSPLASRPIIYAQVDGEPAGNLPISVRISPLSAWLLMPPQAAFLDYTSCLDDTLDT